LAGKKRRPRQVLHLPSKKKGQAQVRCWCRPEKRRAGDKNRPAPGGKRVSISIFSWRGKKHRRSGANGFMGGKRAWNVIEGCARTKGGAYSLEKREKQKKMDGPRKRRKKIMLFGGREKTISLPIH